MNSRHIIPLLAIFLALPSLLGCDADSKANSENIDIILHTDLGDISIDLFDETPIHRDNFLKLAREGYFDGQAFHRVIPDFMVQTGDPRTIDAYPPTDTTAPEGPGYTLPPEFGPHSVNIRGRIGAARYEDEKNPERRSSGSQFYIVTGGESVSAREIDSMAQVYTGVLRGEQYQAYQKRRSDSTYTATFDDFLAETDFKTWTYPLTERNTYLKEGGAIWLDFTYTVFGEVIEGIEIADQVSVTATDVYDRPLKAIRIISTSLSPTSETRTTH